MAVLGFPDSEPACSCSPPFSLPPGSLTLQGPHAPEREPRGPGRTPSAAWHLSSALVASVSLRTSCRPWTVSQRGGGRHPGVQPSGPGLLEEPLCVHRKDWARGLPGPLTSAGGGGGTGMR